MKTCRGGRVVAEFQVMSCRTGLARGEVDELLMVNGRVGHAVAEEHALRTFVKKKFVL